MKIIAADIGGTKSWLCLAELETHANGDHNKALSDIEPKILFEHIYPSNGFSNATKLLETFLKDASALDEQIDRMCLALPGVVTEDQAGLTNLDWQLDREALEKYFSIDQVCFINDFEAAALGVTTLTEDDYVTLNEGNPEDNAVKVVTGAGTGLGVSWLNYVGGRYHSNPSEGGHIDFAPVNQQQMVLLNSLLKEYSHVSYERFLSGMGIENIYRVISESSNDDNANTTKIKASEITARANEGDELALEALTLFISIYGSFIGNLAVLYKPAGGIYIAGGIAAKVSSWMTSDVFIEACLHKGRMEKIVKNTPIYLITNDRVGLQGSLQKVTQLDIRQ